MLLIPGLLQAQKSEALTQKNIRTPLQIANGLAQPMGPYSQDQKLRLVFTLKPPKQEEENAFLEALYKEGSPEYHKFLTAEQFNERFEQDRECYGAKRARRIYWGRALRSLWPLFCRALKRAIKWGVVIDSVWRHF